MLNFFRCSYIIILLLSFSARAAKICYFSLNNSKEFLEMEKFTAKLNRYAREKIEVKEFLTPGESAEEAFSKMVESGEQCDGLVISGHHTGSFGGHNSPVTLSIDYMEKLSCMPQNKNFFSHVKALWLQGCRTLGVGKIETYEDPDYHTERVGEALREDDLPQSFAQLNMEFSATLDRDNPLSSRYLRVFPRATTFGWTKTAPGEKAHSEYSIPFHIANIAKLNDDRGRFFENPIDGNMSAESAVKYLISLQEVLDRTLSSAKIKCTRDEKTLVNAWLEHGRIDDSPFALNNPDLNAYESLARSNNDILMKAGQLDCILKNADNSSLLGAIDSIVKNEALIGYSYNTVAEVLQRLKAEGNFKLLQKVQDKLKGSELLQNFLMRKLASNELGILRKIDYYAFWKEMTGSSNNSVEQLIGSTFVKMSTTPTNGDRNRIDFVETLFKAMNEHQLLTMNDFQQIIDSPNSGKEALDSISRAIGGSKTPTALAGEIFKKIIDSSKSDKNSLNVIAYSIGDAKKPIVGADQILQQIIDSPKADIDSLGSVTYAIRNSKTSIPGSDKIFQKMIESSKANANFLVGITSVIGDAQVAIPGADKILQSMIDSKNADTNVLNSIADAIRISSIPISGADKILQKIVDSPKADKISLLNVASAIRDAEIPIPGADKLLQQMITSGKADAILLEKISQVVEISQNPDIRQNREYLRQLVKRK